MFKYKFYDLLIASDRALPGLATNERRNVDIHVRRAPSAENLRTPSQWFPHWYLPNGEPWLSFAKIDGDYLLRFSELADFYVRNLGAEVVCRPKLEIPRETIDHLLLDQVIPLVINLRGGEALHASAVLTPQGVVAFSGKAGSGKSTLAANFLKAGYPLLGDDCLVFSEKNQGIYAIPAYPGLRLWEDAAARLFGQDGSYESVAHYTTKQRVAVRWHPEAYCAKPEPITRIYALTPPSEATNNADIVIERLSKRDGFMELINYAFRLDITDPVMLKRQFQFLEQVASCVSVRRLIFSRDFTLLPAVQEAILKDLRTPG
jgi:hypothetical protein